MRLLHQSWVCLANEETLHAAKLRGRRTASKSPVLWRRIQVKGTPKALLLEMTSVDARGNTCTAPKATNAEFGFSWADLDDAEFVCKMVAHEQFVVGTKVLQVVQALKTNKRALHQKLATSKPPPVNEPNS
jgi:hypothetical protein